MSLGLIQHYIFEPTITNALQEEPHILINQYKLTPAQSQTFRNALCNISMENQNSPPNPQDLDPFFEISVNNHPLTSPQIQIVQTKIEQMEQFLTTYGLGCDPNGTALTSDYLARIQEIKQLMGLTVSKNFSKPHP